MKEYRVVNIHPHRLEKELNRHAQDGWVFRTWVPSEWHTHTVLLERDGTGSPSGSDDTAA